MKSTIILIVFLIKMTVLYGQEYKIVYQSLDWMPDGRKIAFTAIKVKSDWSDYNPDKWRLYLYDLENKELSELDNLCIYFSISPDGEQIAYDKDGELGKDIFILDLERAETKSIIAEPGKDAGPDWSPDGNKLVFYSHRDGNEELYTIELSSQEITQLTRRSNDKSYNPVWSPISDTIVYYLEKGDSKDQIYITNSSGSFHKNITNDDHHNIFPSWATDGRILYLRNEGELMIINSDGTNKERFMEGEFGIVRMDPSGKKILASKGDGNLYIINLGDFSMERIIDTDILK